MLFRQNQTIHIQVPFQAMQHGLFKQRNKCSKRKRRNVVSKFFLSLGEAHSVSRDIRPDRAWVEVLEIIESEVAGGHRKFESKFLTSTASMVSTNVARGKFKEQVFWGGWQGCRK
jgi:hypothetical protein